jgi:hypothetical protein
MIIYLSSRGRENAFTKKAHFYKNPSRDISKIDLKVFYAVPKNKAGNVARDWREAIENVLEKAARFHKLQFRGKSILSYEVFPEIVILNQENIFYDTERTDKGNPQALIAVAEEIQKRVFTRGGDIYRPDFAFDEGVYRVLGIVYEGVGAAGGVIFESEKRTAKEIAYDLKMPADYVFIAKVTVADGFFILSRQFLTEQEYAIFSPSLLYHEFAHTFGLPDLYDSATNAVFSNDIMGAGRRRPIEGTFIDRSLLINLGVLEKNAANN